MARRSARTPSARAASATLRLAAGLLAVLGPTTALAQAYSADIELVRPTFSTGSLPGVDSALFDEPGTVRGGFMLQYQQNPLIVYADNQLIGSAIKNRAMLHGGVSWDINRSVSLRASLPLAVQFDTDIGDIASDGGLVGDLFVGGKVKLYGSRPFSAALRADVGIPSGSKEIWMGENSFRGVFGPTFTSRVGSFDILADVNVMGRRPVETTLDLVLDSELWTSGGVRYHIWRNRASASAVRRSAGNTMTVLVGSFSARTLGLTGWGSLITRGSASRGSASRGSASRARASRDWLWSELGLVTWVYRGAGLQTSRQSPIQPRSA
jgi:hypothetical protein